MGYRDRSPSTLEVWVIVVPTDDSSRYPGNDLSHYSILREFHEVLFPLFPKSILPPSASPFRT